jgi:hypothetical protein
MRHLRHRVLGGVVSAAQPDYLYNLIDAEEAGGGRGRAGAAPLGRPIVGELVGGLGGISASVDTVARQRGEHTGHEGGALGRMPLRPRSTQLRQSIIEPYSAAQVPPQRPDRPHRLQPTHLHLLITTNRGLHFTRPQPGVAASLSGYTVAALDPSRLQIEVVEGLSQEDAWAHIAALGPAPPLLVHRQPGTLQVRGSVAGCA